MKKKFCSIIFFLVLSGCATYREIEEPKKSFKEEINIKLKQILAIAETSLEISKNAEKLAIEALNNSNQAKANSEIAVKKVDEAITLVNETKKFVEKEVEKVIDITNKTMEETKKYAEEVSQKAIDKADEAVKSANEAAEKAISAANKAAENAISASISASEKAIAIANQTIAEVNRLRATIITKPEEPLIEEEPLKAKYYIIQKGDTLKKIAYKFYKDTDKWIVIYEANKKLIKNPNSLTPGMKIYIP